LRQTGSGYPSGRFLYLTVNPISIIVWSITEAGTLTGLNFYGFDNGVEGSPYSIIFHPDGASFYLSYRSASPLLVAFGINNATGSISKIASYDSVSIDGCSKELVIHPNGQFVYSFLFSVGKIAAFSINENTGALSLVSGFPISANVLNHKDVSISFEPSGKFLYLTSQDVCPGIEDIFSRFPERCPDFVGCFGRGGGLSWVYYCDKSALEN
jgi:6-phosphogluconolactonase (cycloisomerase 2 family)